MLVKISQTPNLAKPPPQAKMQCALVIMCFGLLCVLNLARAEVFNPETTEGLLAAFVQVGENRQDDVIDLGNKVFILENELVLQPDEGHGLVLRNGSFVRPDAADFFRLLRLVEVPSQFEDSSKPVRIEDMQFRNGFNNEAELIADSGGGAVKSHRATVITDSRFFNNRTMGNSSGGAIYHTHSLEISKVFFANNEAFVSGKSQLTKGGAIAARPGAGLFVAHSYFLGNAANEGGAIHADYNVANFNITRSTFDGNKADTLGGAIWSNVGDGELRISNTSFIANEAPLGGGGIYTQSLFATIILNHLTFWGNQSESGNGGGIRALIPRDGSKIVLRNSVVTNNDGGNCISTEGEHLSLKHSAYNLVDDESCGMDGTNLLTGIGSVFSGKLDFYGGSIPSLPIPESSPASNLVPREMCLGYDARDVPRLDNSDELDAFCDAGAFEFVPIEQIDADGDDVRNRVDNCVDSSNPLQSDIDNDGIGDSCDNRDDRDTDEDLVLNFQDNCMTVSNFLQLDRDENGIGDACDVSAGDINVVPGANR